MSEIVSTSLLKTLWKKKKIQQENALLENRMEIIRGFSECKLQTSQSRYGIKINGDITRLHTALERNEEITGEVTYLKGKYREYQLQKQEGFQKKAMYGMNKLIGLNFWQKTVEGTNKTVLFIPKQVGYDHYCTKCSVFHAYLLLEVLKCDLKMGIKNILFINEEEGLLRETRLIPVYGEEATLRKLLNRLDLYEMNNPYNEETCWLSTMRNMMLPGLPCQEHK